MKDKKESKKKIDKDKEGERVRMIYEGQKKERGVEGKR